MQIYKDWLRRNNLPYKEESFGITFQYQGGNFIISENSGDREYLQLIMPGIMDVKGNILPYYEACNKVSHDIKCVKSFVMGGESVWLDTEILLDRNPEIDSIMPRLLGMLHGARLHFFEAMK